MAKLRPIAGCRGNQLWAAGVEKTKCRHGPFVQCFTKIMPKFLFQDRYPDKFFSGPHSSRPAVTETMER